MFVPGLGIAGPQDLPHVLHSIEWAMATSVIFALVVRWRVGERAQPFLVAAIFIVAQMVAMGQLGDLAIVRSTLSFLGQLPERRGDRHRIRHRRAHQLGRMECGKAARGAGDGRGAAGLRFD